MELSTFAALLAQIVDTHGSASIRQQLSGRHEIVIRHLACVWYSHGRLRLHLWRSWYTPRSRSTRSRSAGDSWRVIDAKKLRGGWQGCIWQRPFIRSCTPSKLPPDLHVLNECHIRVLELIPTQIRWLGISAGAVVTAGRLLLAA